VKNKIKAILIDVDDNLLPTDGKVSSEFFKGLQRVSQYVKRANEGTFPQIGWCSGRDRNYIEAVSFFAGLPNWWSVIESGIAIFNPTTKEMLLNPALTPEIRKAFKTIRQTQLPKILKKFPELFEYPGNMINIALERRYGANLTIGECYAAIKEELKDLESNNQIRIHSSKIAIDISPAGIDKASGVKFLSEHAKIPLVNILGIGDSEGDFPMLKLVGQVGCPSKASNKCKDLILERKGHISPFEYAEGVADVIGHFTSRGLEFF